MNPPVPMASGHMLRPRVEVGTLACGQFRPISFTATAGVQPAATGAARLPGPDETREIIGKWKSNGVVTVDSTVGKVPKGKKGGK